MKFSEYQAIKESITSSPIFQDDTKLDEQELFDLIHEYPINESGEQLQGSLTKLFTWVAIFGLAYWSWSTVSNHRKFRKAVKLLPDLITQKFTAIMEAALQIGGLKTNKDKLIAKDRNATKSQQEFIDQKITSIEEKLKAAVEKFDADIKDAETKFELKGKHKERLDLATRTARLIGRSKVAEAELKYARTKAEAEKAQAEMKNIAGQQAKVGATIVDMAQTDEERKKESKNQVQTISPPTDDKELGIANNEIKEKKAELTEKKEEQKQKKAEVDRLKKDKDGSEADTQLELDNIKTEIDEIELSIDAIESAIKRAEKR